MKLHPMTAALPLLPSGDPRSRKQFCRHAGFTPSGVLNAFAVAVRSGVCDEPLLDHGHVGFGLECGKPLFEVASVLHEFEPLDGLHGAGGKLCVDVGFALSELLGGDLASEFRPVGPAPQQERWRLGLAGEFCLAAHTRRQGDVRATGPQRADPFARQSRCVLG